MAEPSCTAGRRVWASFPTGLTCVPQDWGARKRVVFIFEACTMQRVESPAPCLSRGKLRLRDLWRSRAPRCSRGDGNGDKSFWTLVSGLPRRPCASWSLSTPRGRGRLGQRVEEWDHGEASVPAPTSTLHLTRPGALLDWASTEESGPGDSILAHLPASRGPRARPRLLPSATSVFLG